MKYSHVIVSLCAVLFAAGCGKKDPAANNASGASAPSPTVASSARVIEITANDQMKFNLSTIEAKEGEELKIVLKNIGTMPKAAMGHNWVLLKAGTNPTTFATAAATARDTDYIPAALKDQVLHHTKLLGPGESDTVTFKAPAPGEYPFICSFPAHAFTMKGTLIVR